MKKAKIVFTFIGLLILAGALKFNTTQVKAADNISEISEEEYLGNITGVKQINSTDYLNLVNEKNKHSNFIVFFGFKECKYCRAVSPILKEYISENKYPIFYMNMDESFQDTTQNDYKEINKSFGNFGFHGTPTFIYFKSNKIQNMIVGYPLTINQFETIDTV